MRIGSYILRFIAIFSLSFFVFFTSPADVYAEKCVCQKADGTESAESDQPSMEACIKWGTDELAPGLLDTVEAVIDGLEAIIGEDSATGITCNLGEPPPPPPTVDPVVCKQVIEEVEKEKNLKCSDPVNKSICEQACASPITKKQCFFGSDLKCKHTTNLTPAEATLHFYSQQHDGVDSKFIPTCAIKGTCDNINDLLQLLVNFGTLIFGIVGSLALLMFVIGGFIMILSFGNPERYKKGMGVVVAAVIGLIIIFGAYLLVEFLLGALNVKDTFQGI